MSHKAQNGLLSIVVAVVALGLILPIIARAQAAKGDLWVTTSQMSMEGMPMQMPMQSAKVCVAKDRSEPPVGDGQRNCKNANWKRVGNKVTWDVQCTGPTMTGTGEIVYSSMDEYAGTIKFMSADTSMTIKLTGKKSGECNDPK